MRQTDNKRKSAKQTSKKRTSTTQPQPLSTPATARRIFQLLNDKSQPAAARDYLDEWLGDLFSHTRATCQDSQEEFTYAFLKATKNVETGNLYKGHRGVISKSARQNYKLIQNILARLDAGETLESIHAEAQTERGEWQKKRDEELAVEPKDKLSDEWRAWKIRQVETAFKGEDADAFESAGAEVRQLLKGLMADGDFWHTGNMRVLLPHLIIARQEIDRAELQDKRMDAGMKGASTRKARARKGGQG